MTRRAGDAAASAPDLPRVTIVSPWSTFADRVGVVVGQVDGNLLVMLDGEDRPLRSGAELVKHQRGTETAPSRTSVVPNALPAQRGDGGQS